MKHSCMPAFAFLPPVWSQTNALTFQTCEMGIVPSTCQEAKTDDTTYVTTGAACLSERLKESQLHPLPPGIPPNLRWEFWLSDTEDKVLTSETVLPESSPPRGLLAWEGGPARPGSSTTLIPR